MGCTGGAAAADAAPAPKPSTVLFEPLMSEARVSAATAAWGAARVAAVATCRLAFGAPPWSAGLLLLPAGGDGVASAARSPVGSNVGALPESSSSPNSVAYSSFNRRSRFMKSLVIRKPSVCLAATVPSVSHRSSTSIKKLSDGTYSTDRFCPIM